MNNFETEIAKSAKYLGIYYRKLLVGSGYTNQLRFINKTPYDSFIVVNGKYHALELKSYSGNSFPFSNVSEHQIEGLVDVVNAEAKSWLLLNFSLVSPQTYAIPVANYKVIVSIHTCANVKSVSKEFLDSSDLVLKVPVLKRKRATVSNLWDLSVLYSG